MQKFPIDVRTLKKTCQRKNVMFLQAADCNSKLLEYIRFLQIQVR